MDISLNQQEIEMISITKGFNMSIKATKDYYLKDYDRFVNWCEERDKPLDEDSLKKYFQSMARRCQISTLRRQFTAVSFGLRKHKNNLDTSEISEYISKKAA